MSLRSEIIAIQDIQSHDSVGYGSTFIAEKAMKIGIVACGYADGYQRISPTGTPVLVNSIRTKIIGRISMDMLAVDISNIKDAEVGSEVVLWGKSSNGTVLPIDEVAASSGTIGYELMCAVTARVNFINQE
jgi:alanine racemase